MTDSKTQSGDIDFAYGRNHLDGCSCPAITAGYTEADMDDSEVFETAYNFDQIVGEMKDKHYGIVSEERAERAWFKSIKRMKSKGKSRSVSIAREIATTLGWSDE
jgi:hypothetical protein